jgi:hypothetical protein
MHKRQRSRLLGSGIVMLLGCTLALAACNSNSVSGTSQKASGSATVTQAPAQASGQSAQSRTLVEAWVAKIKTLETK